ncbi:LytR C-terminal domain-containing protein [uncultured Mycobacterium sp.]|uniref:LytR C-terminal domain-containing protein n=1 Tax=uncultured Mycobacterium sp. TaxID=171292 RepID=UPI0035CB038F
MNERVPDSSGLPLRAMVMVLLFLGVIFLLVGLQAMGSGGSSDDDDSTSVTTVTTSTPAPAKGASAVHRSDVRVYNISGQEGVAGRTADQLKSAGFNVTEVGNLALPDVGATTVYFSNAAGERDTADAVGKQLNAPVKPRIPAVVDQPPGVIVAVAG